MAKKTTPSDIISVDQACIDVGVRGSCLNCPIAHALYDASGDVESKATLSFLKVDGNYYHTPRSCLRFMNAFDRGKKVKPFRFKLVPNEDA
jgi:hypothetical protein